MAILSKHTVCNYLLDYGIRRKSLKLKTFSELSETESKFYSTDEELCTGDLCFTFSASNSTRSKTLQ